MLCIALSLPGFAPVEHQPCKLEIAGSNLAQDCFECFHLLCLEFCYMYLYCADTLTMDDLGTLMNALHDVIDIWFRFGVQLKVPVTRLNAIKTQYANPDDCLMHMLISWLSNASPSPTWQTVVDALCCASIGRQRVAEKIQQTYCKQDTGTQCLLQHTAHYSIVQRCIMYMYTPVHVRTECYMCTSVYICILVHVQCTICMCYTSCRYMYMYM